MLTSRYIPLVGLLILLTLFLRDVPYFNVFIIGKIWILYLLIFLIFVMAGIRFRHTIFLPGTVMLFLLAYVLTIADITFLAEAIGILIYFSFWIIFIHALIISIKQDH